VNILITGCAGFIGFHLASKLTNNTKDNIFGIDNINNYYDVDLKKKRISILKTNANFTFKKIDITNKEKLLLFSKKNNIKYIVHLAAQAGVRYSIDNPEAYFKSNILGFYNILECSKILKVKHLLYASTSSVYGSNKNFPVNELENTDRPLSFYAASKKTNEVMAYSYSYIYKIPTTGLRFFTVYGPYGRPDMALFKFVKSIIEQKKINLFNKGDHYRDFTYIEDIVMFVGDLINKPSAQTVPYNIFNIGSDNPYSLKKFLKIIETNLNKKTKINLMKPQLGDVHKTHADISKLKKYTGLHPRTKLLNGIKLFIDWYKYYYKKK